MRLPRDPVHNNAIEKLENIFYRWQTLKKNINRRTQTQIANETSFTEDLEKLYDVAHADAMKMITIEEDRAFLEDQRGPRRGYMGNVDTALTAKEERKGKRLKREEYLKTKEDDRRKGQNVTAEADEVVSEEEIAAMTDDELESNFEPCSSTVSRKK